MRLVIALLLTLGLCATGCGRKADSPAPIALDLKLRASLPSELVSDRLIPIQYDLEAGPQFQTPDCELTIFIHFIGADGKKLFQDDHQAELSSKSWKAGQKLSYQRLLVLPPFEKATAFSMLGGVYCVDRAQQPYALTGQPSKPGETRYPLATGTLQPFAKPLSEETIGFEGWYGEEYDIGQRLYWRWMGKESKWILANPARPSILFLEGQVPPKTFPQPTTLTLELNGNALASLQTREDGKLQGLFHLKPEMLGTGTTSVIKLNVSQTFVPKERGQGSDDRVLGLMLTKVYFGPDGPLTQGLEIVKQ